MFSVLRTEEANQNREYLASQATNEYKLYFAVAELQAVSKRFR